MNVDEILGDSALLNKESSKSFENGDFNSIDDCKTFYEQKIRFMKRDNEHRNFIRAFLYDTIFKSFIQLLDECIGNRERLVTEKKEEWQYINDKKVNFLEDELHALHK